MSAIAFDAAGAFDVVLPSSPYPGLRPFEKNEWPIFFGRERMVDEVVDRLIRQHLLVVHGDSGCGKSSLIRAGVLARLEQESARGGLAWRTCSAEPGEAPLQRLAESLAALDGRADDDARIVEIRRVLNFGADAPLALMQLLRRDGADHLCILLDQFEELFAFARRHGPAEARLLVQFLVGALRQPQPGLYVVVTMRSEFLGVCARFPGLAEAVNDAQYLLPRMATLDLLRAIREPATLYGGFVAADLAQRLIADGGGTQDELPLIQHGLRVLHQRKAAATQPPAPGIPEGIDVVPESWRLELADYTSGPGLAPMLSAHADDVAAAAEAPPLTIVEKVFRALTEINADGQAVRRPQTLERLVAVTGADQPTLERVLGPFRSEGASFVRPYGEEPLSDDTRIDISHEALIRSWQSIADKKDGWLAREFQDGLIWKSLLVQAESFERDRSNVLSPSTARERQQWLQSRNAAWAERYGGRWTAITDLVDTSVDAARRAEAAEASRFRTQAMAGGAVVLLILGIMVWYNQQTKQALTQFRTAIASSLWDRLDFSDEDAITDTELTALWEVAGGNEEVKSAFIQQLAQIVSRGVAMGRRPETIVRAIGVEWPSGAARSAFPFVVTAIGNADPDDLEHLARAARALGAQLTPEEAADALPPFLDAMLAPSRPEIVAAYAHAAIGLGPHMTPEQAQRVFPVLMKTIGETTDEEYLAAIGPSAEVTAGLLTPAQARTAFPDVLAAYVKTRDSDQQDALGATLRGLARRIPAAAAPASLSEAMTAAATTTRPAQTDAFFDMVRWFVEHGTEDEARNGLRSLAGQINPKTAPTRVATLAKIGAIVAGRLDPQQSGAAFSELMTQLLAADAATPRQPRVVAAFASVLAAMAGQLTADDSRVAFARVNPAVARLKGDEDEVEELTELLGALTPRLASGQSSATFLPVVTALSRTSGSARVQAYCQQLQPLVQTLSQEQIRGAFPLVITTVMNNTNTSALESLDTLATALAARVSPDQATAFLSLVQSSVGRADDTDQMATLTSVQRALLLRMTPEETRRAFAATVTATGTLREPDQILTLGVLLADMPAALGDQQVQQAFALLLSNVEGASDRQLELAEEAAEKLSARLDAPHASDLLDRVTTIMTTGDLDEEQFVLGQIAQLLAARLGADDARRRFPDILATAKATTDSDRRLGLTQTLVGLTTHVDDAQQLEALQMIATAIEGTTEPDHLERLGAAAHAVAALLSPEQAQATLTPTLLLLSRLTDEDQIVALGRLTLGLAARLPMDQAHGYVRRGIRAVSTNVDDEDEFPGLQAAVDSATRGWPRERTEQLILSMLGWATVPEHTTFWARALVAHLREQPADSAVRTLIGALKFPTVAGEPTTVLLAGLQSVSAAAPGAEAGLAGNLAWAATTYPAIDLDAPPVCPAPPSPGLLCPATER